MECDTGDWGSESMDWNWTESSHPNYSEGSTNSQEPHQQNFKRTTSNVDHSLAADKPLPSSTNLSSGNEAAVSRHAAQQQVEQQHQQATDKSRTSLSVTDSKTIVLSNSSSNSADSQPPTKSGSGVPKLSGEPLRPTVVAEATPASERKNRDKFPPNGPTTGESATAAKTEKKEKKAVDAWSMNGPATVIKQLNFPPRCPNSSKETASAGRKCLFATVDAALLITSQFQLKREESVVPLPLVQPPTAIIAAASGSPQPKLVNASRDLHSGSIINNPAAVKVDPLPGILQSGPPPAPGGPFINPPVKIDSLPGVLEQRRISLPAIRRASATTNGNNYPEILHSATRRLSETERGLKQALAGYVGCRI